MKEIASKIYGRALFEASLELEKLELVFDQLKVLKEVIKQNVEFFKVLKYPVITLVEKFNIIDDVFKNRFDILIDDFLKLLVEKNRIYLLDSVIEEFYSYYYDFKKITRVEVVSAFALSEQEHQDLIKNLENLLHQSVAVDIKVDESLIGGLYIKAKDIVIDSTIKGRLDKMKNNLLYHYN